MNWLLLTNSFLVASFTTLLALIFGFVAALWVAGLEGRWRTRLLALAVIALALPPFLVTNCWLHFLGYTGIWHAWLQLNPLSHPMGEGRGEGRILSLGGTIWILSLLTWPITLFLVWSAWRRLQSPHLESDPAVTGWALIRALLFPLARAALAQAAVLTFVLGLNNFAVPAILQVKVFPAEMWVRFNTGFDTAGVLRLSWPVVVAPLVLLAVFSRSEIPWPTTEGPASAKSFRRQLGHAWFWSCGAFTVALCLVAVGLPLFQLISVKRVWTELPRALAAGQSAVWHSFEFAAASATAVIGLALAAVGRNVASRGRSGNLVNSFNPFNLIAWFLWLPFLFPGVLLGIGLVALFNRPWSSLLYHSAGIVILAFGVRYSAVGWNTVTHALRTVDPDLTDAARLEGAARWRMFRWILWPQIAPQVVAAWYVVFLLCLWDVESMILVLPPGGETLALRIFNLLHYGHNAQGDALCLTLLAVAVAPLFLWMVYCVLRVAWERNSSTNPSSMRSFISKKSAKRTNVNSRGCKPTESATTTPSTLKGSHKSCATTLAACAALLLSACSPKSSSNDAPIQSQFFSRVQIFGSRGVGVGQLNKPRSVAVDAQNNLYAVDMTGRVQKFSAAGVFLLSWQMPQTDLGKPKGMCRDRDGNIVVVEPHYQRLNHFSPEGKLVAQWGQRGTNPGQFTMPRAVAVNSQGEIFVSEYGAVERVQKFALRDPRRSEGGGRRSEAPTSDLRPLFLSSFGHPGTGPGEFNRPEGLCVDDQDRIYVADSCNHRIQVFSSAGKFIRAYGRPGVGKGELSYPYDICVDHGGRQYVCEFGNSRIQVFDASDHPIEILGGPGVEPGKFSNPWGVALDGAGNLYVADSQNHRVQKFVTKQSVAGSQRSMARAPVAGDQLPITNHQSSGYAAPTLSHPMGEGRGEGH